MRYLHHPSEDLNQSMLVLVATSSWHACIFSNCWSRHDCATRTYAALRLRDRGGILCFPAWAAGSTLKVPPGGGI